MSFKAALPSLVLGTGGSISALSSYYTFRVINSKSNLPIQKVSPIVGEYVSYSNGKRKYCHFWRENQLDKLPPADPDCSELSEQLSKIEEAEEDKKVSVKIRTKSEYLTTILKWHNLSKSGNVWGDQEGDKWNSENGSYCISNKNKNFEDPLSLDIFIKCENKGNQIISG